MSTSLHEQIDRALDARQTLFEDLATEGTDAYRLFHGVAEGCPGLTIDRYGPLILAQTFREPLLPTDVGALEDHVRSRLDFDSTFVWNHRGKRTGETFDAWHRPDERALEPIVCREAHVRYAIRARHSGQDPWLFLDLRAGRRHIAELARDRTVLNLFAYTCSAGIAAAVSGAREVWNVDFSGSALDVGRDNARLNAIAAERLVFLREDCLPVLWQLAGLPVKGRASSRPFERVGARRFDLVFLDPPAWSKGPFGAVDVARDYASLFKPALLATRSGGFVIATNHVASIERAGWIESLERVARKAGRVARAVECLSPGPDFPAFDASPPLKIAVFEITD